jgi:hypothetical protein
VVVQGLLVVLSGFLFIFAPGVPMGLLARRTGPLHRDLMYWGIGLWLVALVPGLFLQTVLRLALLPGAASGAGPAGPAATLLALLGGLVAALFVQAAMYWVLRRQKTRPAQVLSNGLPLGFGVGLIAQIFTGLALVGAGFQLLFAGAEAGGPVAGLAEVGLGELVLALLSLVLFRPALLTVSAARGVLVARAAAGEGRMFWAAVLLDALFAWGVVVIQAALAGTGSVAVFGVPSALAALALIVYYGLALGLAFNWLAGQTARRDAGQVGGRVTHDEGRRRVAP